MRDEFMDCFIFFFKQKTAYEMRISDWSSDVCSSDLGGVTNMAEAYGKVTGRPGVAMVTRGPGACNGSIGIHTAMQDSTPLVIFIGQVARDQEYREAFQEVDYRQFYGALCKWVVQIENADRVPEQIGRAHV